MGTLVYVYVQFTCVIWLSIKVLYTVEQLNLFLEIRNFVAQIPYKYSQFECSICCATCEHNFPSLDLVGISVGNAVLYEVLSTDKIHWVKYSEILMLA